MNNTTHPDSELLLAFMDFPEEPQNQQVSVHLATCKQCRSELTTLSRVIQRINADLPNIAKTTADYSHTQQLQSLLDDRLDKNGQAELSQEMRENKNLMKAALHQATHQAAMKKGVLPNNEIAKQATSNFVSIFKLAINIIKRLLHYQTSTWATAALTAALVLTVVVSLPTTLHSNATKTIIAYQDNPKVVFKKLADTQPGIGFFSNIVTTNQTFDKVSVTLANNNILKLNWPKIENVINYTVQVHNINQGQWALLQEKSVTTNSATFDNFILTNNTRYEWRITGQTTDDRSFKASGGFVYDQ